MLEVIGAGFGRTGTLSLKMALERLGFAPCHHMLGLLEKPDEVRLWRRAARGEAVDWDEVYRGYRSTVDWPGARFWRELAERYPAAKVILTIRDPERWYDSVLGTIHRAAMDDSPPASPTLAEMRLMVREVIWDGVFEGRFTDRGHALRIFADHIEAVRGRLPGDRLLIFEVAQGWEPLCEFLGRPVPDAPFPHRNRREDFGSLLREHGGTGANASGAD
ncbi:sulfotransferase family protein [Actinoallomurus rhizosphaericola]|uniref:sulfotransferase family protein n=1 Tax=Actinoallomurus rhizosphaericola TaxID=2952536 RepID=UPI0020902F48|nr:sulfotransferase family protein [Actinoallomurus rhizosphaericola]MCO5991908.1 sulfotransferase family protein [Actinoallomurus rhizosphaericola]